jgi:hypothetical protein
MQIQTALKAHLSQIKRGCYVQLMQKRNQHDSSISTKPRMQAAYRLANF